MNKHRQMVPLSEELRRILSDLAGQRPLSQFMLVLLCTHPEVNRPELAKSLTDCPGRKRHELRE